MAFKKLVNCDSSDVFLWASHAVAEEFEKEIDDLRDVALRNVVKAKRSHEERQEDAAVIRAFDKVKSLLEEARRMG